MTRHGSLYPLSLPLAVQVVRLTGNVAVAGHVAHPDILHVGVDLKNTRIVVVFITNQFDLSLTNILLQRCEGGNVDTSQFPIYNRDLS